MSLLDSLKRKILKRNLEKQHITDNNAYAIRMFYVAIEKYYNYGTNEKKVGETYGISHPFALPNGMTIEDACKVISFISNKVEKDDDIQPASEISVSTVSSILENYGFKKLETYKNGHYHAISKFLPFRKIETDTFEPCKQIPGVVDLFTVGGHSNMFNKTNLQKRYFDWYLENVNVEEVKEIYKNLHEKDPSIKIPNFEDSLKYATKKGRYI